MIFVNFKTYEQGTAEEGLALLNILEQVSTNSQIKIIAVMQSSDIKEATSSSKLEIWAQHIDPVDFGAHTGSTLAQAVYDDGAVGTFLNHSEHKFGDEKALASAHTLAREVGLKTLVFATDTRELKSILRLKPTFASYEPAELVGSETTSVAKAKPQIIEEAAAIARQEGVPLVVGAGIKSCDDVKKSLELGAVGVAVASSIVRARDPRSVVLELIEGFK